MADFSRDLKQYLEKNGCHFERQGKGDHEIWYSPITKIKFVVDNKIKSRHTAICLHSCKHIDHNCKEKLNNL